VAPKSRARAAWHRRIVDICKLGLRHGMRLRAGAHQSIWWLLDGMSCWQTLLGNEMREIQEFVLKKSVLFS